MKGSPVLNSQPVLTLVPILVQCKTLKSKAELDKRRSKSHSNEYPIILATMRKRDICALSTTRNLNSRDSSVKSLSISRESRVNPRGR